MKSRNMTQRMAVRVLGLGLMALPVLVPLTAAARADDFGREHRDEARDHRDEGRERHELGRERFLFHEHDVHRFGPDELGRWRAGQWRNSCFGGRCGWWWFAGGQWYFYDRPAYPYPLVVSEVSFVEPVAVVPAAPPAVIVAPGPAVVVPAAPVVVAPAPPVPAGQVYYYCDNPPGYYPTVPSCPTPFRQVAVPPPH